MMRVLGVCTGALAAVAVGVTPVFAQFDDVPKNSQVAAHGRLQSLRKQCKAGDGAACYEIASMVDRGEAAGLQSSSVDKWTLLAEACTKGYAQGCTMMVQKRKADSAAAVEAARLAQIERRRREDQERLAVAEAQRRAAEKAASRAVADKDAEDESAGTPATKESHGMGLLGGLAMIGSGIASGMALGADASDADRQAAVAVGMESAARLLGDDEAATRVAQAARQQGVAVAVQPQAAAAAAGHAGGGIGSGGGGGYTGNWSYNGAYAAQVRYLLAKVPNWQCPGTSPGDRGITPRLGVRLSSQRDQYVAAAVSTAWGIECYARQGKHEQARQWEPTLQDVLENANELCSGAVSAPGRGAPATLAIWGCPPPIR